MCGVPECDLETSIKMRPRPARVFDPLYTHTHTPHTYKQIYTHHTHTYTHTVHTHTHIFTYTTHTPHIHTPHTHTPHTHTNTHHTHTQTHTPHTHTYIHTPHTHTPHTYTHTPHTHTHIHKHTHIYRVSQEECARLRESVPYVKLYRYNPKRLYPKLNGYGDNGQRSLKL